ncbi:MAG: cation:proton antiporter [Alphaproteobacteria bacterium]|nr:cation:proton antiporter [Alphaproteobacteria bacterium]
MASSTAPSQDILIVLGVAGLVVPLLKRIGINSVLGFLLIGLLLSPGLLGQAAHQIPALSAFAITKPEEISRLAEYGVVFLMFLIGLEISPQRLLTMKRLVFGLGGLQILISTAALFFVIKALSFTDRESLILSLALSLSSTAIVIQIFADDKRLNSGAGQTSFAILLMQDLAVIPILLLIEVSSTGSNNLIATDLAIVLGQAALAVAAIVLLGKFALQPFLKLVAGTKSSDLFMAAVLFIAVGAGVLATSAGLSMSLGAFTGGLMLAETEFRRAIETLIEPFKGLLLGAFFLLVGLSMSTSALLQSPFHILILAASFITVKALVLFGLARLFRLSTATAIEAAALLSPCGEFAFVVIAAAKTIGLLTNPETENILLAVVLSMIAIPVLGKLSQSLMRRQAKATARQAFETQNIPEDLAAHVIIVGYGRVGKMIASMLDEHEIGYIVLDTDVKIISQAKQAGKQAYFGDASNPEFLSKCGLSTAKALAVTMDNASRAEEIVRNSRLEHAALKIIARARDEAHAMRLYAAGATEAVPETIEASLQLGEALLVETGIAMGLAIASVHERRDELRKALGRPNRREMLNKRVVSSE